MSEGTNRGIGRTMGYCTEQVSRRPARPGLDQEPDGRFENANLRPIVAGDVGANNSGVRSEIIEAVARLGREIAFTPTRRQNAGDDGESVPIKDWTDNGAG